MVWLPKSELSQSVIKYFTDKLLIVPRKLGNYGDDVKPEPIKCWVETPTEIGVPRAWWFATAQKQYEYEWDVTFGEANHWSMVDCRIRHEGPYANQAVALEELQKHFNFIENLDMQSAQAAGMSMGGVLTNMALSLVHRMATTALIVVHKEFLLRQWVKRAEQWLPGVRVGVVQGPRCEFEGKDLVVAMVESLALDEDGERYPAALYNWPGLLIYDELHRVGAKTWAPVPQRFSSAYRLGLTATPRRKDGADSVFWWHIGPIVCRAEIEMPKPMVRQIAMPKSYNAPPLLSRHEANDATVVTLLTRLTARNWRITQETLKALRAPGGRKVLVLSERLEHLRQLEKLLREELQKDAKLSDVTTGFYVGEWFTGEVLPRLAPKEWSMEGDGWQKAIKLIYTSVSRRKGYSGQITKTEDRKLHAVRLKEEDLLDLGGRERDVYLETLAAEDLFRWARYFKIQQKKKERMRPLSEEELYQAERARVIYASYQMVAEGVDLPAVDTLGLVSPISDIEQAAGRVRRFCVPDPSWSEKCAHFCPWRAGACQGKATPVIFDVVDEGLPLPSKRERYRQQWYWDSGFKIARGG
jgi:hypothetical protein